MAHSRQVGRHIRSSVSVSPFEFIRRVVPESISTSHCGVFRLTRSAMTGRVTVGWELQVATSAMRMPLVTNAARWPGSRARYSLNRPITPVKGFNTVPVELEGDLNQSS